MEPEAGPPREAAKDPGQNGGGGGKGDSSRMLEWIKAIGMPLVTLVVTLLGGWYLTNLSKEREARESSEHLYAQLLTQREQSDAQIRKDMFGVVISSFFANPKQGNWAKEVLHLELLANNFSQSLDLSPLFQDLARRLSSDTTLSHKEAVALRSRLDRTASDLILKQVTSLGRRGYLKDAGVRLAGWEKSVGTPFIDVTLPKSALVPATPYEPVNDKDTITFTVEVSDVNIERREVEVRLRVDFSDGTDKDLDRHFWVGQYDFPMLDNTQLPFGLRTSVVITEFNVPDGETNNALNTFVQFHLVVFPATSASFKERQDYDDILLDMLRGKGPQTVRQGKPP